MFISIQADEIFDLSKAQSSETHPSFWLAQLRKTDWQHLLKFVNVKLPVKTKKKVVAEKALEYFEFVTCDGRGDVWQMWSDLHLSHRLLIIQFRHSETNWSCGTPEFINLDKGEPLGLVNIAGRLLCRVK